MSKSIQKSEASATTARVVESLVLRGDISALSPEDRAAYYIGVCESLGLNPSTQPFAMLRLNGKEVMYPTRGATDQLAAMHRINREIIDGPKVVDIAGTKVVYAVCRATHPNGRTETAIATLPLVDPAMVFMKAETKCKRRATLSILGLGMLDESEVESIPAHEKAPGAPIDLGRARPVESARELPLSVQRLADDLASLGDGLSVEQIASVVREHYDAIAADGADALIDAQAIAKKHAPEGTRMRVGQVFNDAGRALAARRAQAAAPALPAAVEPPRAVAAEAEQMHPALVALRDALATAGDLDAVAARWREAAPEVKALDEGDRHEAWQLTVAAAARVTVAAAARVTGEGLGTAGQLLRAKLSGPDGDGPKGGGPRGGKRPGPRAVEAAPATPVQADASTAPQARAPHPESAHFVESTEAWAAHCVAYAHVDHLRNGWAKHSPAFNAAGLYEARLHVAAARMQALTSLADIDVAKVDLRRVSRIADERAMRAAQSEQRRAA